MSESKWIIFKESEHQNPEAKTKKYVIYSKEGINQILGEVKWFGSWRKYSFFPATNTVFEVDCLNDIVKFINYLMLERKVLKQQEKQ